MSKRVFIVHGWDGFPEEGWFPWLKQKLEAKGFDVEVPAMPLPAEQKIETWVSHLSTIVGEVNSETFFVGHSIGCQTIIRYLEQLPGDVKIGGVIFVAGWFVLTNAETPEEQRISKPWIETPIDYKKVKSHTNTFTAIFSDNDPVVPLVNKQYFEERLGATTIVEHGKGHFSGGEGVTELPIVVKALLTQ